MMLETVQQIGLMGVPMWMVVLIVAGIAAVFGWWSTVWTWIKAAYTKITGNEVPDWLDGIVTSGLTKAKWVKAQLALKALKIEFSGRGDTEAVAAIDSLITKAATWDE